jgi:hypothetical protein
VKSNADGSATIRRMKNRAASEVPLEKDANGRKKWVQGLVVGVLGVAESLLEEVVVKIVVCQM